MKLILSVAALGLGLGGFGAYTAYQHQLNDRYNEMLVTALNTYLQSGDPGSRQCAVLSNNFTDWPIRARSDGQFVASKTKLDVLSDLKILNKSHEILIEDKTDGFSSQQRPGHQYTLQNTSFGEYLRQDDKTLKLCLPVIAESVVARLVFNPDKRAGGLTAIPNQVVYQVKYANRTPYWARSREFVMAFPEFKGMQDGTAELKALLRRRIKGQFETLQLDPAGS